MSFFLLIGVVVLLFWVSRLSQRVTNLESQIFPKTKRIGENLSEEELLQKIKQDSSEQRRQKSEAVQEFTQTLSKETPEKLMKNFVLEEFLGRKFFAILGALSVILAIGFFVMWAFEHGWIGPQGRIALGLVTCMGIIILGDLLRTKYPTFFDKITAVGIGGALVTIFLARNYSFEGLDDPVFSPGMTFFSSVVTVAIGLALSLRYDRRFLANFSIIVGIIAPLLVNSEPNPVGLLSYLVIFAVAGFVISLFKKWPEVVGILFMGILCFEIGIYHLETPWQCVRDWCNPAENKPVWSHISPLVFLGFVYGLHALLGSGGVMRSLYEKPTKSPLSGGLKVNCAIGVFEALLFVGSIFSANLLGWAVFEHQDWDHFGFFILAQGFLFFGLSLLFQKKNLEIFRGISLGATLVSIIFATIWEMWDQDLEFILTLMLIAEGILFSLAGKKLDKISGKIFEIFGRIALIFPFFFIFAIEDLWMGGVAILAFILGNFITTKTIDSTLDKVWAGVSLFMSSVHIFWWNFVLLGDEIYREALLFAPFILPVIFGVAIAFSVLKSMHHLSRVGAMLWGGVVNIVLWFFFFEEFGKWDFVGPFLALVIVFVGNFAILSTYFLDKFKPVKSAQTKAVIWVLSTSCLGILFFGREFLEEPVRSIFWILWGGILLGLGFKNSWKFFRYFGLGVFLFLIGKLYLVDVWAFEVWVRFLAFLALGIALLGISFFYSRHK